LAATKRIIRDRVKPEESEVEVIVDNRDGTKSHYYLPKILADLAYPTGAGVTLLATLRRMFHL